MSQYEELIKALRSAQTVSIAWKGLMVDVAAAIEELQAEVKRLKSECDELIGQMPELVETADGWKWEPKRGEWIFKSTGGSMGFKTCSVCGYQSWQSKLDLGNMGNYCPNCGAKMGGTDE